MEGEFSGAVKQHKSTPALDYCCPSPQLGLPAGSRGPHTGRGRWTQIPTLKDLTLKARRLFLSLLFPSRLHVRAEIAAAPPHTPATAHGLFLLQRSFFFLCSLTESRMKAILLRCFPTFFSCYGDTAGKLSVCESDASVNESNTGP